MLADVADERGRANAAELGGEDHFVHCDVTSEDEVAGRGRRRPPAAAGSRSACTAVVAGSRRGRSRATAHRTTSTRSAASVELNLVGSFNMLRLSASAMAKNEPDAGGERGACVLTASIAGYEGQIGQIAYGSAKAGVIGMTIIARARPRRRSACG